MKTLDCAFWTMWGMALQAFITSGLTAAGIIEAVPWQQLVAGCLYVLICSSVALWKIKSRSPQDGGG